MLSKRVLLLISLLIITTMVAVACQPAAPPAEEAEAPASEEAMEEEAPASEEAMEEEAMMEEFIPDESKASGMIVKMADTPPKHGGTLKMALNQLAHLDPVSIAQDSEPYVLFYEGLFEFDPEWKPIPLLVESVDISSDGLVHTWKLHEGVKFHDGSNFNAEVVKWNVDRKIEQETPYSSSIPWVDDPIKVIDEYTVEATISEPSFVMYNYLSGSSWVMYSKEFVESATADDLKNQAVGTGPFIVKEYKPNDMMMLERNPDYWQKGLPFFDAVDIRFVDDPNSRLLMLEAGEIDFNKDLSIQDINRLEGDENIMITTGPSTRIYHIILHTLRPALDTLVVREALNLAIDREKMNESIFDGRYNISTGFATPNVGGYASFEPYTYDPDEAKRLLDEAGMVDTNGDGFREWDGEEKTFILVTISGQRPGDIEIATQFQAFMKEVGIDVEVEVWDSATFWTKLNQPFGEAPYYDMLSISSANFIADISYPLETTISCSAMPGTAWNYAHYCNEEVDELVHEGNVSSTLEERNELYRQAQSIVWDDLLYIKLFDGILTLGSTPNLKGIFSDGAHNVWQVKYAWFD